MKKALKRISLFVLFITLMCIYSFGVYHVASGGNRLGFITKPLMSFITFPKTISTVLNSPELLGIPPTYMLADTSFHQFNNLNYNLIGLNSFYNLDKGGIWEIRLFNLKDDSIIHQWYIEKGSLDFTRLDREYSNSEPINCILLPNRSIIVACNETYNLFMLNNNSDIVWHNTAKIFHHSLNMGIDSNIWICTSNARGIKNYQSNNIRYYKDDNITKIDYKTGQILYNKSIVDMLSENGNIDLVFGFGNQNDPIHINDIQPVLIDSKYWKTGDLFLSLRNRSVIILYRPETNKIISMLSGPFLHQHDVDIISDKEIALFSNNNTFMGVNTFTGQLQNWNIKNSYENINYIDSLNCSKIIIYNFEDSTYRTHLEHQFEKEKIFSESQGLFEILSSGDTYVESQNDGKIYIMNDNEILLKKSFNSSIKNMIERPHWIRIYEHVNL